MANSLFDFDSFDDYTALSQKWAGSTGGGSFAISTANPRTGNQSLSCNGFVNGNDKLLRIYSNKATVIAGFAVDFTTFPGFEAQFCSFFDNTAGANQVELTIDGSGNIRARRGGSIGSPGTLLGTASSLMPFNSHHYLEFMATVSSSVGVVKIWLDGVQILNLSGQNTQNTANTFANAFRLAAEGNQVYYVDDFYLLDPTAGGLYSDHLGDVKMITSLPTGNGTQNDYTATFASFINNHGYAVGESFKDSNNNVQRCTVAGTSQSVGTPTWATTGGATTTSGGATFVVLGSGSNPGAQNWMAASEVPPDDNSSYVTDATVGHVERYTYPALSGSAVKAVVVGTRSEKDDAGTRTLRLCGKSGGTTFDSGSDLGLALNSYTDFQGVFETDPNTGVAWTVSGVNAAEFGVKTTS